MRIQSARSLIGLIHHILPFIVSPEDASGNLHPEDPVGPGPEFKAFFIRIDLSGPDFFRTRGGFRAAVEIAVFQIGPNHQTHRIARAETARRGTAFPAVDRHHDAVPAGDDFKFDGQFNEKPVSHGNFIIPDSPSVCGHVETG